MPLAPWPPCAGTEWHSGAGRPGSLKSVSASAATASASPGWPEPQVQMCLRVLLSPRLRTLGGTFFGAKPTTAAGRVYLMNCCAVNLGLARWSCKGGPGPAAPASAGNPLESQVRGLLNKKRSDGPGHPCHQALRVSLRLARVREYFFRFLMAA